MSASEQTTLPTYLQALGETGATGLEPATSGVTGQRSQAFREPVAALLPELTRILYPFCTHLS
jgi:hypothetical protein